MIRAFCRSAAQFPVPLSHACQRPSVTSKVRLAAKAKDFLAILDGVREQGIRHTRSRGTPFRSFSLEHLLDRGRHASAHPAFP